MKTIYVKKILAILITTITLTAGNVCLAENWTDIPYHSSQKVDLDSIEKGTFEGDSIVKLSIRQYYQSKEYPSNEIRWWVDKDTKKLLGRTTYIYDDNGNIKMTTESDPNDKSEWTPLSPYSEVSMALSLVK